jgi:hypothetical protein
MRALPSNNSLNQMKGKIKHNDKNFKRDFSKINKKIILIENEIANLKKGFKKFLAKEILEDKKEREEDIRQRKIYIEQFRKIAELQKKLVEDEKIEREEDQRQRKIDIEQFRKIAELQKKLVEDEKKKDKKT